MELSTLTRVGLDFGVSHLWVHIVFLLQEEGFEVGIEEIAGRSHIVVKIDDARRFACSDEIDGVRWVGGVTVTLASGATADVGLSTGPAATARARVVVAWIVEEIEVERASGRELRDGDVRDGDGPGRRGERP